MAKSPLDPIPPAPANAVAKMSAPNQVLRQKRSLSLAGWAVPLIALPSAIQAAGYLRSLFLLITFRGEVEFPESVSVYGFLSAYHTHRLYLPPLDFPWIAQPYGPLHTLVGALFAAIFHGRLTLLVASMRSLSLVALLGSAAIVVHLCARLEQRKSFAVMAAILALGCYWLTPWAASAKSDLPSAFLFLVALALYLDAEGKRWPIFLAGCLAAASFFTKQSTAALLFALFLDCMFARRIKAATAFIAGGLVPSIVLVGTLWIRREPFIANFFIIGNTRQSWVTIPQLLLAFARLNQLAVIPIAIAFLGAVLSWKDRRYRSILLVTAFAWLFAIAALANVGANYNYVILPWFLLMLFVPAGLRQLEQWAGRSLLVPATLFLLAAIITIHQRSLFLPKPAGAVDASAVANLTMLSDFPYLEMRSREPQMLDPFLYNLLENRKLWSDAPIRQRIDAEHYDLLLLSGNDEKTDSLFFVPALRGASYWGADVLKEMTLHYRPLCATSQHLALVPRDRASSVSAATLTNILQQPCRPTSRQPVVEPGNI